MAITSVGGQFNRYLKRFRLLESVSYFDKSKSFERISRFDSFEPFDRFLKIGLLVSGLTSSRFH